ncbi:MAG: hypothetical protein QOD77_1287 [Thermoplasmata archaeon]|jgi:hypothetical protein|nr:hypothetical protein [Thermoplasmata archaeon]
MDNIDNTNDYGTMQHESPGLATHDKGAGVRTYRPSRPSNLGAGSHLNFKESSPEEIQKFVSDRVAKAVAAAAGAVEGFATQMRESKVAENTKDAIEKVGETATTIVGTTRQQFQNTKGAIQGGHEGSGYGDDTASSSGSEISPGSRKGKNNLGVTETGGVGF